MIGKKRVRLKTPNKEQFRKNLISRFKANDPDTQESQANILPNISINQIKDQK